MKQRVVWQMAIVSDLRLVRRKTVCLLGSGLGRLQELFFFGAEWSTGHGGGQHYRLGRRRRQNFKGHVSCYSSVPGP